MDNIKSKLIVLFSLLFFLFGATTYTIQNASASASSGGEPCYDCGSVENCEDGGLDKGYTDCNIDWSTYPDPESCQLSNFYCEAIPGEG